MDGVNTLHADYDGYAAKWQRCRDVFEEQFTVARMARDYVRVYERLRR